MTIYDLVTSNELASYWEMAVEGEPPYLGATLFPADKKLGLDLKWIVGKDGLPIVLKPSAFDAVAIPRPRIGFASLKAEMPYFKESTYVDEEQRQELNKIMESGNQAYIDAVLNHVFKDEMELLRGASAQRERMRMMLLTTGMISITANGQNLDYDYLMPEEHKVTVGMSWSNPKANIIEDIRKMQETVRTDTGITPTRAVCTSKVFGYLRTNEMIRTTLRANTNGEGFISDKEIKKFFKDQLDLEIVEYDKMYVDEAGKKQKYVPEDVFVLFPSGNLGTTWFGTTPQESDLMANPNLANVSIVDTGVSVTTSQKVDPVNVETIVAQICLPSCPTINQIAILDVNAEA